jgi:hypothetical protein
VGLTREQNVVAQLNHPRLPFALAIPGPIRKGPFLQRVQYNPWAKALLVNASPGIGVRPLCFVSSIRPNLPVAERTEEKKGTIDGFPGGVAGGESTG